MRDVILWLEGLIMRYRLAIMIPLTLLVMGRTLMTYEPPAFVGNGGLYVFPSISEFFAASAGLVVGLAIGFEILHVAVIRRVVRHSGGGFYCYLTVSLLLGALLPWGYFATVAIMLFFIVADAVSVGLYVYKELYFFAFSLIELLI